MQLESRKLLVDIQEASAAIMEFVHGKSLAEVQANDILRSGIYFKFVIIGEALSQLRHRDLALTERITEYGRIIGFRNQIIHGYGAIDDEITWRIVEAKVPVLLADVQRLLSE